jgi:hypothetical protein
MISRFSVPTAIHWPRACAVDLAADDAIDGIDGQRRGTVTLGTN